MSYNSVDVLLGETLEKVTQHGVEEIVFVTTSGKKYRMYHSQRRAITEILLRGRSIGWPPTRVASSFIG